MECTQRLELTQDLCDTQVERICPEQVGFLGICGKKYPVKKGPNKVGRDPTTCQIILNLNSISRQHAVINILNTENFMLMDLDSANKTKLSGHTLQPYIPQRLHNGDTIQFGDIFGIFRLLKEEVDLPMTQAIDILDTPVPTKHVSRINAMRTVPESPDVSDKDDSFIVPSQPKGAQYPSPKTYNFIKPGKTISIQPIGSNKIDNIYWNSSKKSTSLNLDDSNESYNDSIPAVKLESKMSDDIHELETQMFPGPKLDEDAGSIYSVNTQLPNFDNPASIHTVNTQMPAATTSPSIHSLNTQLPCGSSPPIHNVNTQLPDALGSLCIHTVDTQLPGDNLPEVCKINEQQDMQFDLHVDESDGCISKAETELHPAGKENVPRNSRNKDSPASIKSNKHDKSNDDILFDEVEQPYNEIESQAILTEDIELPFNGFVESDFEPLSQIVKSKSAKRNMRIKSDDSTGFTDDNIIASQKILDNKVDDDDATDCEEDNMIELQTETSKIDVQTAENFEDMATQVIVHKESSPVVTNDIDFEDMPTQVLDVDVTKKDAIMERGCTKIDLDFEDLPTQVLDDDLPITKQPLHTKQIVMKERNSPFKIPLNSPLKAKKKEGSRTPKIRPIPFITQIIKNNEDSNYYQATQDIYEDLCTQRLLDYKQTKPINKAGIDQEKSFDKSISNKPFVVDAEKKPENIVANQKSLEMIDFDNQVTQVKKGPSNGSNTSHTSDVENTPTKQGPFKFMEIDLPNSQEIKASVSLSSRAVITESSSESEPENFEDQCTPIVFRKKRKQKPVVKLDLTRKLDFDALPTRVITRLRKPTEKLRDDQNKTNMSDILKFKYMTEQDCEIDKEIIAENISRLKSKNGKSKTAKSDPSNTKNIVPENIEISAAETVKKRGCRKKAEDIVLKSDAVIEKGEKTVKESQIDKKRKPRNTKKNLDSESQSSITDITTNQSVSKVKSQDKQDKILNNKNQNEIHESTQSPVETKRSTRARNAKTAKTKEKTPDKDSQTEKPKRKYTRKATKKDLKKENMKDLSPEKEIEGPKSILKKSVSLLSEVSAVYNTSSSNLDSLKRPSSGDSEAPSAKRTRSRANNSTSRSTPTPATNTQYVLFTAFPFESVKSQLEGLGAVVVADVMKSTVILTMKIKRTFKLLCAVGLGKPIVGPDWVQACVDNKQIVDPWLYLIKDKVAEKRLYFNLERTLKGKRNFLKGYNLSSTPNVMPQAHEMKMIVESSGGSWREGGPRWVCVSCPEDKALWAGLRARGAALVGSEFILGGALRQQLDLQRTLQPYIPQPIHNGDTIQFEDIYRIIQLLKEEIDLPMTQAIDALNTLVPTKHVSRINAMRTVPKLPDVRDKDDSFIVPSQLKGAQYPSPKTYYNFIKPGKTISTQCIEPNKIDNIYWNSSKKSTSLNLEGSNESHNDSIPAVKLENKISDDTHELEIQMFPGPKLDEDAGSIYSADTQLPNFDSPAFIQTVNTQMPAATTSPSIHSLNTQLPCGRVPPIHSVNPQLPEALGSLSIHTVETQLPGDNLPAVCKINEQQDMQFDLGESDGSISKAKTQMHLAGKKYVPRNDSPASIKSNKHDKLNNEILFDVVEQPCIGIESQAILTEDIKLPIKGIVESNFEPISQIVKSKSANRNMRIKSDDSTGCTDDDIIAYQKILNNKVDDDDDMIELQTEPSKIDVQTGDHFEDMATQVIVNKESSPVVTNDIDFEDIPTQVLDIDVTKKDAIIEQGCTNIDLDFEDLPTQVLDDVFLITKQPLHIKQIVMKERKSPFKIPSNTSLKAKKKEDLRTRKIRPIPFITQIIKNNEDSNYFQATQDIYEDLCTQRLLDYKQTKPINKAGIDQEKSFHKSISDKPFVAVDAEKKPENIVTNQETLEMIDFDNQVTQVKKGPSNGSNTSHTSDMENTPKKQGPLKFMKIDLPWFISNVKSQDKQNKILNNKNQTETHETTHSPVETKSSTITRNSETAKTKEKTPDKDTQTEELKCKYTRKATKTDLEKENTEDPSPEKEIEGSNSVLKKSVSEVSAMYNTSSSNLDNHKSLSSGDSQAPSAKRTKSAANNSTYRLTATPATNTQYVLFTAFPFERVKNQLESLGAVVVTDVMKSTVILTIRIKRTFKLLCAVGLGKPIVGPDWVQACLDNKQIVDPWLYLIKDKVAEKRLFFNLERTLKGKRNYLKGYNVSSTPSILLQAHKMKLIVESSGGSWREGGPRWVCVSCPEDKALWAGLRARGAALVGSEFILGGALRQQLDLQHTLQPYITQPLHNGDTIQFGDTFSIFRLPMTQAIDVLDTPVPTTHVSRINAMRTVPKSPDVRDKDDSFIVQYPSPKTYNFIKPGKTISTQCIGPNKIDNIYWNSSKKSTSLNLEGSNQSHNDSIPAVKLENKISDDIHELETEMFPGPFDEDADSIYSADTQLPNFDSPASIHTVNTQMPAATTSPSIHSLNTQLPCGRSPPIHSVNPQLPDALGSLSIHIVDRQTQLPGDDLPEVCKINEQQDMPFDLHVDESDGSISNAETQLHPAGKENVPRNSSNNDSPASIKSNKHDKSNVEILFDVVEQPCIGIESQAILTEDIELPINGFVKSDFEPLSQIVKSKSAERNLRIKSDDKDPDRSDELLSQIVKCKSAKRNMRIKSDDSTGCNIMASQKIFDNKVDDDDATDCEEDDMIELQTETSKIDVQTADNFEDMAIQVIVSKESSQVITNEAYFADMPISDKPFVAVDAEKKSENIVTNQGTLEMIDLYNQVTQVANVPSNGSNSSYTSDLEDIPKKQGPFKFLEIDLPNSQEIKDSVSLSLRAVVTESSSESEPENFEDQYTPIVFRKKRKQKPVVKLDLIRKLDLDTLPTIVITRVRKPTEKLRDEQNKKIMSDILKSKYMTEQDCEIDKEIIAENISRLKIKNSKSKKAKSNPSNKKNTVLENKEMSAAETVKMHGCRKKVEDIVLKSDAVIKKGKKTVQELQINKKRKQKPRNTKKDLDSESQLLITDITKNQSVSKAKSQAKQDKILNYKNQTETHESTHSPVETKRSTSTRNAKTAKTKDKTTDKDSQTEEPKRKYTCKATKTDLKKTKNPSPEKEIEGPKSILKKSVSLLSEVSAVYNTSNSNMASLKRPSSGDSEAPSAKRTRSRANNSTSRSTSTPATNTQYVLFTAFPFESVKSQLESLGAVVVTDVMKSTVILTRKIKRTFKLLCAVGLGKPIVGPDWVQACVDNKQIIDPWLYLIKDKVAEKQLYFNLERTLKGKRNFLKGYNLSSTPSVLPRAHKMKLIVESSGGSWREGGPRWVCVSCPEDKALWAGLRARGAALVGYEFILGGALRQQLDLQVNALK